MRQSFTLNPDGSFDYTPNPDFSGDDSFTYHANDDGANGGNGADSNVATVTITVNEVNDAPVAVDDGGAPYTTNEDGGAFTTAPSVLTNDTDPEDDPLTAVLNTGPTNASAFTLNPDGTFSYTPNADFFGTDTFTYHANDGNATNADSNVATVTITVNAVNDAPSFTASNPPTVLEDAGPQTVPGWATFSPGPANESGQTVLGYTVSNVSNPALFSGLPAVAANGTLTYTPAANAFGSSTFDVVVQDSGGIDNGGDDTSGLRRPSPSPSHRSTTRRSRPPSPTRPIPGSASPSARPTPASSRKVRPTWTIRSAISRSARSSAPPPRRGPRSC